MIPWNLEAANARELSLPSEVYELSQLFRVLIFKNQDG